MTSKLFTPIQLGGITLPNRIVVAPMCQYSADDGCMSDWHSGHLSSLAISGVADMSGLVITQVGADADVAFGTAHVVLTGVLASTMVASDFLFL